MSEDGWAALRGTALYRRWQRKMRVKGLVWSDGKSWLHSRVLSGEELLSELNGHRKNA